jgi:hypothetical protein
MKDCIGGRIKKVSIYNKRKCYTREASYLSYNKGEITMAKRRKKSNSMLWYALYAVAGYYAYNWYMKRPQTPVIPIAAP